MADRNKRRPLAMHGNMLRLRGDFHHQHRIELRIEFRQDGISEIEVVAEHDRQTAHPLAALSRGQLFSAIWNGETGMRRCRFVFGDGKTSTRRWNGQGRNRACESYDRGKRQRCARKSTGSSANPDGERTNKDIAKIGVFGSGALAAGPRSLCFGSWFDVMISRVWLIGCWRSGGPCCRTDRRWRRNLRRNRTNSARDSSRSRSPRRKDHQAHLDEPGVRGNHTRIRVYVPAQYKGEPAKVMVFSGRPCVCRPQGSFAYPWCSTI